MKWNGQNRKTSPVDDDHSVSHYQENTRMRVDGELRRRHGMSRSSIEKIATPILGISSLVAPVPGVAIQGNAGAIFGYSSFTPQWGDVQLLAPTGTAVFAAGYIYTTGDGRSTGLVNIQTGTLYTSPAHRGYFIGSLPQGTWNTSNEINTGGVNGLFYRVTFTCAITGTVSFGPTSVAYTSDFYVTDPTAYGWILDSYSSNLTVATPPVTTTSLVSAVSDFTTAGTSFQLTMVYITKGGGRVLFSGFGSRHDLFAANPATLSGTYSVTTELRTGDPSTSSWTITVNRTEAFDTSYDIYGKDGAYPIDPSDGEYVGSLTINPGSASTSGTVAPSVMAATWKFIAVPRSGSLSGPSGLLT